MNITRRDFLKLCGSSSLVTLLAACGVTPTPSIPTSTPLPISTLLPTATVTPAATLTSAPTRTVAPTATPQKETLRDLAERWNLKFGAHTNPPLDKPGSKIISDHFNLLKPGAFGFGWIHRDGMGKFNLQLARDWISQAKRDGQTVIGGPLVYHLPGTLTSDFTEKNYSQEAALAINDTHITTMLQSFPEGEQWTLTQESFWVSRAGDRQGWQKSPWNQSDVPVEKIPDYILRSFVTAKKARPNAELVYSDNGVERDSLKARRILDLAKSLRNTMVDGSAVLGRFVFELQTDGDNPFSEDELLTQIDQFRQIGVKVGIEIDVFFKSDAQTLVEKRPSIAAEIYRRAISACLRSKWCDQIILWDPIKENSWHNALKEDPYTPFANDPKDISADVVFQAIKQALA